MPEPSLAGGHAAGQSHHLGAGHTRVDEQAGVGGLVDGHRLGRRVEVDAVGGDEGVDDVEVGLGASVELDHAAVLDDQGRHRVRGRVEGHQAEAGVGHGEAVEVDVLGVHEPESPDGL